MQQPLAVIGGFVVALPTLPFVVPTGMRLIYCRRSAARELAEHGQLHQADVRPDELLPA